MTFSDLSSGGLDNIDSIVSHVHVGSFKSCRRSILSDPGVLNYCICVNHFQRLSSMQSHTVIILLPLCSSVATSCCILNRTAV